MSKWKAPATSNLPVVSSTQQIPPKKKETGKIYASKRVLWNKLRINELLNKKTNREEKRIN